MLKKKRKQIYFFVIITTYKTIEYVTNELQNWKSKAKSKLHQDLGKSHEEIIYLTISERFYLEGDPFSKNAQNIAIIMHDALLLKIILQAKPQTKKRIKKFISFLIHYHSKFIK